MPNALDDVMVEALKLSPEDRAELIERLADSVVPTAPLHPLWEEEIARRIADMDEHPNLGIPFEQVMAQLRAKIEAGGSGA